MSDITIPGTPNIPDFEEDPNSPWTSDGSGPLSGTLANDYDEIVFTARGTSGNSGDVEMTVNGRTDVYEQLDRSDSGTTGLPAWTLVPAVDGGRGFFASIKFIEPPDAASAGRPIGYCDASEAREIPTGTAAVLRTPYDESINSFELTVGGGAIDGRAEVLGRNL